jgi:hypothetical protein
MPERVSIGFGRNAIAIYSFAQNQLWKNTSAKTKMNGANSLENFCKPVKFPDEILAAEMFFVLQN